MSNFKTTITTGNIFSDVKLITPDPFHDYRGEMWTFWEKDNEVLPIGHEWKISKFTRSRKNVLRGLHGDNQTWKHISCVWGEIYLVVADTRPDSPTYGEWDSFVISDRNHLSVLVPAGYLNGHYCLSGECVFHYTQSYPNDYVDWQDQTTAKWNDELLNIEWPTKNPILNWRDK